MSVTPDQLKDYIFGELNAAERREVEAALASNDALREEYARLQMTQTALMSVREEEMPRRIAFVSDKVFEPKWWQGWLNSGPRMAFASSALVAGAIVFHAVSQPAPVAPVAQMDQAQLEQRIAEGVARALPAALAEAEQKHQIQLASAMQTAEGRYKRLRQDDVLAMEAAYSLWREKQAAQYVAAVERLRSNMQ